MKIMCALLGVMLIAAVGCESKQEKAQDKMVGLMNDYADALAGIKSNTDFIDAKPKLERIGAKMKDAMNEYKNLPKPSADEQKKLEKKFNDSGEKVSKRIQDQIQRLAKIGVSPIDLMGAMQIDPSVMGD
jgi:hypothetical protein